MPDVTPRERYFVELDWCDGGADLRDRQLLIWQSMQHVTIRFLSDPHYEKPNLPLPDGLRKLTFGPQFNWKFDHIRIPDSVEIIQFGEWFNQSLAGVVLPSGLRELRFGNKFNQSLDDVDLPADLQILQLGNDFSRSLSTVPKGTRIQWSVFAW